ncbi:MAG: heme NO-binding domain-containing protein [Anaerolineae bacterium]|jgi:hypothetical protein|nr:heme NO-binding domain-containing protein [Anaerolineae bacterium]
MIGMIDRLLFEFVHDHWGSEAEAKMRAATATEGQDFRGDVYYPDTQWKTNLKAAMDITQLDEEALIWAFGHYSGVALTSMYSGFITGAMTARDIITRQPRIHNTLASSFNTEAERQKVNEKFRLEEFANHTVMHYQSSNQLCTFYRSLAQWVADHFNETIEVTEPNCLKRGDHECEIHIRYLGKKG